MTTLVQISPEETRHWSSSPLIVNRTPLDLRSDLAFRRAENTLLWRMSWYSVSITLDVCVIILWFLRFGLLLVPGRYKEDYLQVLLIKQLLRLAGMLDSREPV